jgi:biopolymer transport protein ExbD
VVVSVDENDEVRLDGNPLPVEELQAAVQELALARKSTLALQADRRLRSAPSSRSWTR